MAARRCRRQLTAVRRCRRQHTAARRCPRQHTAVRRRPRSISPRSHSAPLLPALRMRRRLPAIPGHTAADKYRLKPSTAVECRLKPSTAADKYRHKIHTAFHRRRLRSHTARPRCRRSLLSARLNRLSAAAMPRRRCPIQPRGHHGLSKAPPRGLRGPSKAPQRTLRRSSRPGRLRRPLPCRRLRLHPLRRSRINSRSAHRWAKPSPASSTAMPPFEKTPVI